MRFETLGVLLLASGAALLAASSDKAAKVEGQPRYDPATVIDVMATVTEIREVPRGNALNGVHLIVKVESETMEVYLGPADFLKQFEISFAKGEEIQIVGSRVKLASGAGIVLAREVRKGDSTLYCRRKSGEPNWE